MLLRLGCDDHVAADDGVDTMLAITIPTAIADLVPAITTANVAKTLAAAVLSQPEVVRLLPRGTAQPGDTLPARPDGRQPSRQAVRCYALPESAIRAPTRPAPYRAWRDRDQGTIPRLGGLRQARRLTCPERHNRDPGQLPSA